MVEATPIPWHGIAIMAKTAIVIFGTIAVVLKVAEWLSAARDELRDRYTSRDWTPVWIDLAFVPLWLVLEVVCLAGAVVFALVLVYLAYQTAKDARDWWHAGSRTGRR